MKQIFTLLITLSICSWACGQSNELIGQYTQNLPSYNPAHTGMYDYVDINLGFRQQWIGYTGSPYNTFLSGYGAIRSNKSSQATSDVASAISSKHGIGGYMMMNGQGAYKQTETALVYAFHVPITHSTYLSLGMSPTITSEKINTAQITVADESDKAYQALINQGDSYTSFRLNTGLGLYSQKFYVSYSLREAGHQAVSGNKEMFDKNIDIRHHFMGAYVFNVNEKLDLVPNSFVRIVKSRPALVEVGMRAQYNKNLWAGLSFRNDKTMVGMFGLLFNNKWKLGYAFEYKSFGISSYTRGTHEIIVGVRLFNNKPKKAPVVMAPVIVAPPQEEPAPMEEVVVKKPINKTVLVNLLSENNEKISGGNIEIRNVTDNNSENQLTKEDAPVNFSLQVGKSYEILASKEGYESKNIIISTSEFESIENQKSFNIILTKKALVIELIELDIKYDVSKADLKPEALPKLEKVIELLKQNPQLKVEIGSHTDSRGSAEANYSLSQKRAESVVSYLVSKGIDKTRLVAKGYGETNLKVKDAAKESDHAQNRRTTVKVLPN